MTKATSSHLVALLLFGILGSMIFQSPSMAPVETASAPISADAWIMVGLTVLTLLFAIWSWWSANKSKKAREAAETAEGNANRRVLAAESTADELRKLVESLKLPSLVATASKVNSGRKIYLRNTTDAAIEVVDIVNRDKFYQLRLDENLPFIIPSDAQAKILAYFSAQTGTVDNLHLKIQDSHGLRDVHVPIPHVP